MKTKGLKSLHIKITSLCMTEWIYVASGMFGEKLITFLLVMFSLIECFTDVFKLLLHAFNVPTGPACVPDVLATLSKLTLLKVLRTPAHLF